MSLFRPVNSAESNLFTIRASFGIDSQLGNFNNLDQDCIIASNDSNIPISRLYLASPSTNNLPLNFVVEYQQSTNSFLVTYGKQFTQQPNVNITPHSSDGFVCLPSIQKKSLKENNNHLIIKFVDISGSNITPSVDGLQGLLGFDIEIIGPIKIGITTGNSNKGWAINDVNGVYSFMDINLGSGNIAPESVIISKNLKFLSGNGNVKTFSSNNLIPSDYGNTVWELNNVALTNITPQKGMFIILYRNGLSNSSIQLSENCFFNNNSIENKLTFETNNSSAILYAPNDSLFIILNTNGTVSTGVLSV
jgi:hypothetical protein